MFNDSNQLLTTYHVPYPLVALPDIPDPPSNCYDYPRPAYTADTVVRDQNPFKGNLALPGGFVNEGETSLEACRRELREETGLFLTTVPKLVGIYDKPGRDPRGWTVSACYSVRTSQLHIKAGDDATDAKWCPINLLGKELLSFDHFKMINDAWEMERV